MKITFLGTNGWFSSGTGNTPCMLIESSEYYVVFDAGDGVYKLDGYITSDKPIFLFLSHFHLEHIIGFHIFNKFRFSQRVAVYGQKGTKKILGNVFKHPYTIPPGDLPFKVVINELSEGTHLLPFPLTCRFLRHADPCLGYRIELDGKAIAYCTDTGICENSLKLADRTDLLVHESAYKNGQHDEDWPHTTPDEAAYLAVRAKARQLALVHFDASLYKTIDDRKQAEAEARKIFPNTVAATDGMMLEL
jgi:ribonuclease BN (tRNA processing enzyme)